MRAKSLMILLVSVNLSGILAMPMQGSAETNPDANHDLIEKGSSHETQQTIELPESAKRRRIATDSELPSVDPDQNDYDEFAGLEEISMEDVAIHQAIQVLKNHIPGTVTVTDTEILMSALTFIHQLNGNDGSQPIIFSPAVQFNSIDDHDSFMQKSILESIWSVVGGVGAGGTANPSRMEIISTAVQYITNALAASSFDQSNVYQPQMQYPNSHSYVPTLAHTSKNVKAPRASRAYENHKVRNREDFMAQSNLIREIAAFLPEKYKPKTKNQILIAACHHVDELRGLDPVHIQELDRNDFSDPSSFNYKTFTHLLENELAPRLPGQPKMAPNGVTSSTEECVIRREALNRFLELIKDLQSSKDGEFDSQEALDLQPQTGRSEGQQNPSAVADQPPVNAPSSTYGSNFLNQYASETQGLQSQVLTKKRNQGNSVATQATQIESDPQVKTLLTWVQDHPWLFPTFPTAASILAESVPPSTVETSGLLPTRVYQELASYLPEPPQFSIRKNALIESIHYVNHLTGRPNAPIVFPSSWKSRHHQTYGEIVFLLDMLKQLWPISDSADLGTRWGIIQSTKLAIRQLEWIHANQQIIDSVMKKSENENTSQALQHEGFFSYSPVETMLGGMAIPQQMTSMDLLPPADTNHVPKIPDAISPTELQSEMNHLLSVLANLVPMKQSPRSAMEALQAVIDFLEQSYHKSQQYDGNISQPKENLERSFTELCQQLAELLPGSWNTSTEKNRIRMLQFTVMHIKHLKSMHELSKNN